MIDKLTGTVFPGDAGGPVGASLEHGPRHFKRFSVLLHARAVRKAVECHPWMTLTHNWGGRWVRSRGRGNTDWLFPIKEAGLKELGTMTKFVLMTIPASCGQAFNL